MYENMLQAQEEQRQRRLDRFKADSQKGENTFEFMGSKQIEQKKKAKLHEQIAQEKQKRAAERQARRFKSKPAPIMPDLAYEI